MATARRSAAAGPCRGNRRPGKAVRIDHSVAFLESGLRILQANTESGEGIGAWIVEGFDQDADRFDRKRRIKSRAGLQLACFAR